MPDPLWQRLEAMERTAQQGNGLLAPDTLPLLAAFREAVERLRPFAHLPVYDERPEDDDDEWPLYSDADVTIADVRRARAFLERIGALSGEGDA